MLVNLHNYTNPAKTIFTCISWISKQTKSKYFYSVFFIGIL